MCVDVEGLCNEARHNEQQLSRTDSGAAWEHARHIIFEHVSLKLHYPLSRNITYQA